MNRRNSRILGAAVDIREAPPSAEDLVYTPPQLIQCTLPHTKPSKSDLTVTDEGLTIWERTNGRFRLQIQPGFRGFPYGTLPRLIMFWLSKEVRRREGLKADEIADLNPEGAIPEQHRQFFMQNSWNGFLQRDLGIGGATGGKTGTLTRFRDQAERLFQSRILFEFSSEGETDQRSFRGVQMSDTYDLWLSPKAPNQMAMFSSHVTISEYFYRALANGAPLDLRVIRSIQRSALALDLYSFTIWRSFRCHRQNQEAFVPWSSLAKQLGSEYSEVKEFARRCRKYLKEIEAIYGTRKTPFRIKKAVRGKQAGGIQFLPMAVIPSKP